MADSDGTKEPENFCSFCNSSSYEVKNLIAGPRVFICYECVRVCNGIMGDQEVHDTERNRPIPAFETEMRADSLRTALIQYSSSATFAIRLISNGKNQEQSDA